MKIKLSPSPLHFPSSFQNPAAGIAKNIKNAEANPSTSPSLTASPANTMLGRFSPTWVKKAIKEYSSPKKHEPQWTPSPQWEPNSLLVSPERGEALLKNLKLHKENVAKGHFGSVSIFENQNGEKLVGKFLYATDDISENEFFRELDAFKGIYEAKDVGRHPNLVNMYGVASMIDKSGVSRRAILMEAVPGPTGTKLFDELRKRLDAGKISPSKYWGVIQFLGRRLFDVVEHMSKADVIHNDIKPDNFLVHEKTGEPVLIDLGGWSWKDDPAQSISEAYAPPEVRIGLGVDEKSDVFGVGASLFHGIEGGEIKSLEDMPNRGLSKAKELRKDEDGNVVRQPRTYAAETAYSDFISNVLKNNKNERFTVEKAKNHDFLNDALLDDDAAKTVIIDIIKDVKKEEEKLAKENEKSPKSKHNSYNNNVKQTPKKFTSTVNKSFPFPAQLPDFMVSYENRELIQRGFRSLMTNPNLHTYASLQSFGKNDPEVKKYLEKKEDESPGLKQEIEKSMILQATAYIALADWFAHAKSVFAKEAPTLPVKIPVQSGVDENGVRSKANGINPKYAADADKVKNALSSYVDVKSLKHYVESAEEFLYKAKTLKRIDNQETKEKIEQVRERAELASRMLEIFEPGSSPSEGNAVLDNKAAKEAAEKGVLMSHARMKAIEKYALTLQEKMENKRTKKSTLEQMKNIYTAYNHFNRGQKKLK